MDNYTVSIQSSENKSCSNTTYDKEDAVNDKFRFLVDCLHKAALVLIMVCIGCDVTLKQIKNHLTHPVNIITGIVSQFFIIPLTTYAMMRSTAITGIHATTIFILACCPNEALSNVYTYFFNGDMSLSLTMTFCSILLTIVMMQANMWIYGTGIQTKNLILPYEKLSWTVFYITAPILMAMVVKQKLSRKINMIKKVGSSASFLILTTSMILIAVRFPEVFTNLPRKLSYAVISIPLIGFSVGYILAFSSRQDQVTRKTMAMQCSLHNSMITLSVISMSFKPEEQNEVLLLPWLHSFVILCGFSVLVFVYKIYYEYKLQKATKEKSCKVELIGDQIMK